jgi:hypothetical protein
MRRSVRVRGRFGLAAVISVTAALAALGLASSASAGGGAKLTIIPTSHNYGSQLAGTAGSDFMFTVTNTGGTTAGTTTPLAVTKTGTNAAEFEISTNNCTGPTLGAGSSCTIFVRFHPGLLAMGNRTAKLNVSANPGGGVSASLTGTATNAHLTISPTSWNFGSVVVNGGSSVQSFNVTNDGTASSGPIISSISGAADFAVTGGTCGAALPEGNSCQIEVTFDPASGGNKNAKLNVSASPGGTLAASLTGTGAIAKLTISPGKNDFGSVPNGTGPTAPATFTVTNTGSAASANVTYSIGGTNPTEFSASGGTCGASGTVSLAIAGSCTILVTFSPGSPPGGKKATLNVAAGAGEGAPHADLVGKSISANLTISPTTKDFGNVHVGDPSSTQTFTVKNTGNATSGVLSITFNGTNSTDFTQTAGTCVDATTTLTAGGTCTVVVTFTPGDSGARSGSLDVSTPNPAEGTASASLSGTGIIAVLEISPSTGHDFGSTVDTPFTFTISNTGTDTSGSLTITLGGTDPGSFTVSGDGSGGTCDVTGSTTTLAPSGSCTVDVTFKSGSGASQSATLDVTGGAGEGTPSAPLDGSE